jgi:hypothetical protein
MEKAKTPQLISTVEKKHTLSTSIKRKFFNEFNHIVENPPIHDILEFNKVDIIQFKFNDKNFGYLAMPETSENYYSFYRNYGTPYIFGMYNLDKAAGTDIMIGLIVLVLRYDYNVWQIMDLKIKKDFRGKNNIDKFISSTLTSRILKSNAYYGISMNPNIQIDKVAKKMHMPKMKSRGKMNIYLVDYIKIKELLPTLEVFYCSDIGFIDNNKTRNIIDSKTKKPIKILHLHHNATYCEYVITEPKAGFQYCFSIHDDNEYIIHQLKNNNNVCPIATANVYSNNFKVDWSKFVKTFEI